jgi:hypothetical protein
VVSGEHDSDWMQTKMDGVKNDIDKGDHIFASLDNAEFQVSELAEMVDNVRLDLLEETNRMNPEKHKPNWDFDNNDGTWGEHEEGMGHRGGLMRNTRRKKEIGDLVYRMWTAFDELTGAINSDQLKLRNAVASGYMNTPMKKLVEGEIRRKRKLDEVHILLSHVETQMAPAEEEDAEQELAKMERLAHASTHKPKLSPALKSRPISGNPRANLRNLADTPRNIDSLDIVGRARAANDNAGFISKTSSKRLDPRPLRNILNHRGRLVGQTPQSKHVRYRHMTGSGGCLPSGSTVGKREISVTGTTPAAGEEALVLQLQARKLKRDDKGYRCSSDKLYPMPTFHRSSRSLTQLNRFDVRPSSAHTFVLTRGEESRPRNRVALRSSSRTVRHTRSALSLFKLRSEGAMGSTTNDPVKMLTLSKKQAPLTTRHAPPNHTIDDRSIDLRIHTKFRARVSTPANYSAALSGRPRTAGAY